MNKIPKFRAWHKELKVYAEKIYVIDFKGEFVVVHHNGEPVIWYFNEIILEQYIGLNDKNDVEIFKGDIVRYFSYKDNTQKQYIAQVIFTNTLSGRGWYLDNGETVNAITGFEEFEVVGNIHEGVKDV